MKTDNSTAQGILTGTIKQKRSKAIDMPFYWLKDRAKQGQFEIYWEPGKNNLADYPTKHHSGTHHATVRPIYLYDAEKSPTTVKGCVEILARTGNKIKPTRENETGKHSSLAGVRTMYRTRTNHPPRARIRERNHFLPLVKKQPLYNNIQNTNVRSSGIQKKSMHNITDSSEYSKQHVNHIIRTLKVVVYS